jgi:hypothetical protein
MNIFKADPNYQLRREIKQLRAALSQLDIHSLTYHIKKQELDALYMKLINKETNGRPQ